MGCSIFFIETYTYCIMPYSFEKEGRKQYSPHISDPFGGRRSPGGRYLGPHDPPNPALDLVELESLYEWWDRTVPNEKAELYQSSIDKNKRLILERMEKIKRKQKIDSGDYNEYSRQAERQRKADEEARRRQERRMAGLPPEVAAEGRFVIDENAPLANAYVADSQSAAAQILRPAANDALLEYLQNAIRRTLASTDKKFTAGPTLVNAVKIALEENDLDSLDLIKQLFAIIKEKSGDNYEHFKNFFGADMQRLEDQNIGRGIILKQKLKGFEVSNDGYGVEVDKLFTQITKQTLVDVMKQLGETQAVSTLMKKSKMVLTNYFMSKYATKYHTGSKAVADNRKKKKENSPQEKRQAEYFKERNKKLIQERFEQSKMKPRPPPVRRGKKDTSL